MKKYYLPVALGVVTLLSLLPASAWAVASIDFPGSFAGLASQDLKLTIANIVRIVLGFLGILTVVFILYAGFLWMTSGGNEDKIDSAKKLISAAVVGLVIILASYAIASFVAGNLSKAV